MDFYILFLLLHSFLAPLSSSTNFDTLRQGSSLSVEHNNSNVLVSKNGVYMAGFFPVGTNAFGFGIWFAKSSDLTVVWMANRDQPVNGRGSKLSLTKHGNLVLLDAGRDTLWSTETTSPLSAVTLQLDGIGNLVLRNAENSIMWESFKFPTHTLLPDQKLTMNTTLISSKSPSDHSSGYYRLYFDDDNIIRMLYQGPDPQISSVYWPYPWRGTYENERSTYNNSKIAVLNITGGFSSSDNLSFIASDYGSNVHRRLTIDPDGNLRLYSLDEKTRSWIVTWEAFTETCKIHGICGPSSLCTYDHALGRKCSCLQGFKMKRYMSWSYECEPEFQLNQSTNPENDDFFRVANVEFYGYDINYFPSLTLRECKRKCLELVNCKGFQFKSNTDRPDHVFACFPKALLLNGQKTPSFHGDIYIRVPRGNLFSYQKPNKLEAKLNCLPREMRPKRMYKKCHENGSLKILLWVAVGLAGVEFVCVTLVFCFLYWTKKEKETKTPQGYMLAATRFQEFTYSELRKAAGGFREEIGSGAGGTVYKGVLSDGRVAAIKRLRDANQGEAEFLAEVSTIGRLNHMNLIEMWGYCAEGKHRLLVYECMEHGSLADNLNSTALDWEKRFAIAMGTSRGLAYLHEECLEWVLHCDVKPQNILLDSNYNPKVADFGLSKLQNRGEAHNSSFSRIRGTRGYMAPEWVYNLPITSKVDVYSYGIVALELVTGRKPTGGTAEHAGRLVTWVREKVNGASTVEAWIEEIANPIMGGKFDRAKMEVLVKVALHCVEEDKEARPTMRQVVEMLQCHEDERAFIFNYFRAAYVP